MTDTPLILREVGLRDGLQSIAPILSTAHKQTWIRDAHAAGIREIEVGSCVPARYLPQLADTDVVAAYARTLPGLVVSVLVPNLRGAQRALDLQVDRMLVPLSVSHAHSLANVRKTPDEVVAEIAQMRAARDAAGAVTHIECTLSTAFGCTIQGAVAHEAVVRLAQAALDAGADSVGLADTVGYAAPGDVEALFSRTLQAVGDRLDTGHFHDTRGMGLANALTARRLGIHRLDASLGGFGGCPHAPGASGNIATEDAAFLFENLQPGITGIDLPALLTLSRTLASWLPDIRFSAALPRAGLPATHEPVQAG